MRPPCKKPLPLTPTPVDDMDALMSSPPAASGRGYAAADQDPLTARRYGTVSTNSSPVSKQQGGQARRQSHSMPSSPVSAALLGGAYIPSRLGAGQPGSPARGGTAAAAVAAAAAAFALGAPGTSSKAAAAAPRRSVGGASAASLTPEGLSMLSPGLADKYACPSSGAPTEPGSAPGGGGAASDLPTGARLALGLCVAGVGLVWCGVVVGRWWYVSSSNARSRSQSAVCASPSALADNRVLKIPPTTVHPPPTTINNQAAAAAPPSTCCSAAAAQRPAATCGWTTTAAAATPPTCPSLARRPAAAAACRPPPWPASPRRRPHRSWGARRAVAGSWGAGGSLAVGLWALVLCQVRVWLCTGTAGWWLPPCCGCHHHQGGGGVCCSSRVLTSSNIT